jgi:hypothetical protein
MEKLKVLAHKAQPHQKLAMRFLSFENTPNRLAWAAQNFLIFYQGHPVLWLKLF